MQPTDLDELAAVIDGAVISPGIPRYDAARLVWNSRFDDARPMAVIRAADVNDVRTVVEFARDHSLPLRARSGAHSFAGYSTGDCLIVDLSALTAVTVDPSGERARLGAGSTMLPTYRALWPHKMAIAGGTCPTVGIAGLTAGGGLGVLSRRHGLTCDSLVEVELVTSSGRLERANEREHADLLWATRGGGGGNFGIITALTFELAPVDVLFTELTYELPWSAAESLLAAWQKWLPGSPSQMWTAVELVTSSGRLERANEHEHADLLWATRGGGGGNFGIITALTFELAPVDGVFTELTYELPWSAAESVLAAWQEWLPGSPSQMWTAVELETQAPGAGARPTVVLEVVHAGSREEAEAAVADLLGAAGVAPIRVDAHSGPFVDIEHDFFCKGLRAKECTLADKSATGQFPREAFYARSDVAARPWPSDGLRTLVEWMEKRQCDPMLTPRDFSPTQTIGKVLLEAADGAVNSIAADATAFVHRNNLFVAQFQSRWWNHSSRAVLDANIAWADELYAAVRRYRSGFAYQNYIDPRLDDWQHAYYGTNLPRLRAVKSKYDPDDLFNFAQSVPPA